MTSISGKSARIIRIFRCDDKPAIKPLRGTVGKLPVGYT